MKRIKSVRGVEVYETKAGLKMVYIRYQSGGKQYSERVGPSEKVKGRDVTMAKARRVLDQRRRGIAEARAQGQIWRSPKDVANREREIAAEQATSRDALVFEKAYGRFLKECGDSYARPEDVRRVFENRLSKAFEGRYLDEVTRKDIRDYFDNRLSNSGPFAENKRKVGLRTPQTEIAALSALYGFLIEEEERELNNPCLAARSHRRRRKAEVYRPARKPVIASKAALRAIFDALPGEGHQLKYRALFKLLYYTGGRPESEPCRLTHGDVELPDRSKVRTLDGKPVLGKVTFRDTKTGGDRTLPVHPEAEKDLAAVMDRRPDNPSKLSEWEQRPIFRKRGSSEAMDRDSYRKAWQTTIATVAKSHPELATMVPRDLRKTFRTHLTNSRVPEPTIRRLGGWSVDVSQGYHELTDEAAEAAILALTLRPRTEAVDRNRGPSAASL